MAPLLFSRMQQVFMAEFGYLWQISFGITSISTLSTSVRMEHLARLTTAISRGQAWLMMCWQPLMRSAWNDPLG